MNAAPMPGKVWRGLVGVVLTVLVLLLTARALQYGAVGLPLAVPLVALACYLIGRPERWFTAAMALYYSWIYVPSLPPALSLHHIVAGALLPVLAWRKLTRRTTVQTGNGVRLAVGGYAAVLLYTVAWRGFGLRMFGGDVWGGAAYVHLAVSIGLFLLSDAIDLNAAEWRRLMVLFFAAGMIPSLAELVFLMSKGHIHQLYYFIKPEGTSASSNLASIEAGTGLVRFQVSRYMALLFVMALALYRPTPRNRAWVALACGLAFLFGGLSGHRMTILFLLVFVAVFTYLARGRMPWGAVFGYGVGGAALTGVMHVWGRDLPQSIQRAFSWLPFADVTSDASFSALATRVWRVEIWKRLVGMIPTYWLVGRGFTFSADELMPALRYHDANIQVAIASHNYHNGPLSLLIDVGVPGFILGTCILAGSVVRHWRLHRRQWRDALLWRAHRTLLAAITADAVVFYTVHGDACYSIVGALMLLTVMEGLYRCDRSTPDADTPDTANADTNESAACPVLHPVR